jgi:hypothetical protein
MLLGVMVAVPEVVVALAVGIVHRFQYRVKVLLEVLEVLVVTIRHGVI